tara:strand:+ start:81 stop:509 length:429 start_codon:yes stop_codon:yes gene_type:complete
MKYINTFFKAGLVYPALLVAMLIALYVVPAVAEDTPYPVPRPEEPPTQLLLNMTVPCSENGIEFISDTVNKYQEQEFASGEATIKPLMKPNLVPVDLLMYVSPSKRTFTIFSLQKVGEYEVACIIAGGHSFTPFVGEYRSND